MKVNDIRHVFVIGAGTMGRRIALRCASSGYDVTVYDASPEALKKAPELMRNEATEALENKWLTAIQSQDAFAHLRFTSNPQDAATADLISESILEDPDVKAKVFAQFAEICPPHTVFTTDTSTLAPSLYSSATGRPDRFAAFHFNGVWPGYAPLVDVMPVSGTSQETIELLRAFASSVGQIPMVLKRETPGYIANNIVGNVYVTAYRLVLQRDVPFEDVDRAAMGILGMKMGPFGALDFDALDFIMHQMQNAPEGDVTSKIAANWLKREYIDKGRLGRKSGRGFYSYPNPAFERPDFLNFDKPSLQGVADELKAAIDYVALRLVVNGAASFDEVDRAVMVLYCMPIGCFGLFDREGLDVVWRNLQSYAETSDDPEDQTIADWLKKDYLDKGLLGEKSGRGFYAYPNPAFQRPDFLTGGETQTRAVKQSGAQEPKRDKAIV